MALCPFATVKLIPKHNKRRALARFRINGHQAVSRAQTLYGYFSVAGVCSHFYINEYGGIEQYIDTDFYSGADLDGNDVTISIETWDNAGLASEWNPAQVLAYIRLCLWILSVHPDIPQRLATSSVPGSNKGLSWHRLGVPSKPPYKDGWLQPGGVRYSNATGKTCPGDGRIAQIKGPIAAAVIGGELIPTTPVNNVVIPIEPVAKEKREPSRLPTLQRGSKGNDVRLWQEVLVACGYSIGKAGVDADFGNATHNATVAWQRDRGLVADGVPGGMTWTRAIQSDANGYLSKGDVNPQVEVLQAIVGATRDKIFGTGTAKNTGQVQRFFGIADDEVAGQGLVNALRTWW